MRSISYPCIIHCKLNKLCFYALLAGAVFILELKATATSLTAVTLMYCWFPTHAFHGFYLLTKWALHIDLSHYELSEKNKQLIRQSPS